MNPLLLTLFLVIYREEYNGAGLSVGASHLGRLISLEAVPSARAPSIVSCMLSSVQSL